MKAFKHSAYAIARLCPPYVTARGVFPKGGRDQVELASTRGGFAAGALLTTFAWMTWRDVVFLNIAPGIIMAVAILSTPGSFRLFQNEPANTFIAQFPYIWLPTVLVPTAWIGHLLLFRRLQS